MPIYEAKYYKDLTNKELDQEVSKAEQNSPPWGEDYDRKAIGHTFLGLLLQEKQRRAKQ